jgi:hypothetical protein
MRTRYVGGAYSEENNAQQLLKVEENLHRRQLRRCWEEAGRGRAPLLCSNTTRQASPCSRNRTTAEKARPRQEKGEMKRLRARCSLQSRSSASCRWCFRLAVPFPPEKNKGIPAKKSKQSGTTQMVVVQYQPTAHVAFLGSSAARRREGEMRKRGRRRQGSSRQSEPKRRRRKGSRNGRRVGDSGTANRVVALQLRLSLREKIRRRPSQRASHLRLLYPPLHLR